MKSQQRYNNLEHPGYRSLLAVQGIDENMADKLFAAGVLTAAMLAGLDSGKLVELIRVDEDAAKVLQERAAEVESPELSEEELASLQIIVAGGVAASPGAASGEIVFVEGTVPESIPEGCILAARNAAPELAALMDRAGGIITAMGGAASHLASVAREMGIPALFGV